MLLLFWLLFAAKAVTVTQLPETGTPPLRRYIPQGVVYNNNLYTFGGTGLREYMNQLHKFDMAKNIWERIEPIDGVLPMARITFCMYTTDQHIYVHGGLGPNGQLNDLWKFDPLGTIWTRIEQKGDVPPPFYRVGFTDFIHNDTKYFATSCFGTATEQSVNDLYLYNPETREWREMPKIAKDGHEIPDPRRMCNLNYYDGYLYLWGGNNDPRAELLYRYDLELEQWEFVEVEGTTPRQRTFFHSTVYKDSIIIFPGWRDITQTNGDDFWKFDLTQMQSTSLPKWEEFAVDRTVEDYDLYLPRDAYAFGIIDNLAYMHAGYSVTEPLGNFLISIDLDTDPLILSVISGNADSPTNRYYHTMTVIEGKFYMYGGSTGTTVLDELWIYDEQHGTWELKESIGTSPGPRMGHSATCIGNTLIIFGGRNGLVYYKDIYSYNTLTNIWESFSLTSDQGQTALEGTCMLVYDDDIYFFGGRGEFRSNNYIWKFKLGDNDYERIDSGSSFSRAASSYTQCYAIKDKMYLMYGMDDDTYSMPEIHIFDLKTYRWTIYDKNVPNGFGLSSVASAKVDNIVISANGSRWQNRCYSQVYVMNFDTGDFSFELDLPWAAYAEAAVYYKNNMYVFGGGGSSEDGAIHLTLSVDRFYKLTFEDLPCSEGTYRENGSCTPCPKGTYKENVQDDFWTLCPPGSYNGNIAGQSAKNWLPCPENYFNDLEGQAFWYKCPKANYCPAGATQPYEKFVVNSFYTDKQPKDYEGYEGNVGEYVQYALYTLITLLGAILIGALFSQKFKNGIGIFDLFTQKHNYQLGKPMVIKRTWLGGMFTLFTICWVFFLLTESMLYFVYDNVEETKALLPIVVMKDEIRGDITITISLNAYGGECVQSSGQCHQDINFTHENMSGTFSELAWNVIENNCEVTMQWNNCKIEKDSEILLSSFEFAAYAASITLTVSAQSSIPDEPSYIEQKINAEYLQIFRGSNPSEFHIYAIPSLFESDIKGDPDKASGYHLQIGDETEEGSSFTVENLAKSRYIYVLVMFSSGESALHTKRVYKLRNDTLILAIIGGFAGVIQVSVILLRVTEKQHLMQRKRVKAEVKGRIIRSKTGLGNYFDALPDLSISSVASSSLNSLSPDEKSDSNLEDWNQGKRLEELEFSASTDDITYLHRNPPPPSPECGQSMNAVESEGSGSEFSQMGKKSFPPTPSSHSSEECSSSLAASYTLRASQLPTPKYTETSDL